MRRMRTALAASALLCLCCTTAKAQQANTDDDFKPTPVNIHGTIRSKYEYQTEEGEGRFEVRNARISVDGQLSPIVFYKAEIDLCDEGKIKMLDAYTRLKPVDGLQFTIGQMRVPFTIDAHRSPHQQYFANRSFIARRGCSPWLYRQCGFPHYLGGWPVQRFGPYQPEGLLDQERQLLCQGADALPPRLQPHA